MYERVTLALERDGIVVAQKGDWQVWWHYFVPLFFLVAGVFSKKLRRSYKTHHMALGRVIYLLDLRDYFLDPARYDGIILHERMHCLDRSVFYYLSYAFSRRWRAYWEYRAYAWNVWARFQKDGIVSEEYLEGLAWQMSKGPYMINDANAKAKFNVIYEFVRQGLLINPFNFKMNEDVWKDLWEVLDDF